jgi:hypothetical protein
MCPALKTNNGKVLFSRHPRPHLLSRLLYCILGLLVFNAPAMLRSQCMMIPLGIDQHFQDCELVAEGEVTGIRAFETDNLDFIFTAYQIRLTKIFKGQCTSDTLEIVEVGGTVGSRLIRAIPAVELRLGETGTFFLRDFNQDRVRQVAFPFPTYRAFANKQSVYSYNFRDQLVSGVFDQYPLGNWYARLENISHTPYQVIGPLTIPSFPSQRMMATISGFTPSSISAGTYSALTINGSGFGATMGTSTVQFKAASDPNSNWFSATPIHIQSWSNTQIVVWVPAEAGTGEIQVVVGGTPTTSTQILTVLFNEFNFEYLIPPTTWLIQCHHQNDNGMGGYTFNYQTEFNANAAARSSFERALDSWRCATDINWVIGPTTAIDVTAEDGSNVIRWDDANELDPNTAGQVFFYENLCFSPDYTSQHIREIDIRFNDALPAPLTWEFGPGNPSMTEIDFETVAVHELGHAHLLGHVINSALVMHRQVDVGQVKRNLGASDIAGGNDVLERSFDYPGYCSQTPMTHYRNIKYVDHTATGIESGDVWGQAYKELQDALVLNTCTDTIYIANGTYYPDEGTNQSNNNQTSRFLLDDIVVLMGGYPSGGGTRNLTSHVTILSGDLDKNGVTDANNSQTVVHTTANAHIDGVTIERGYADGASGIEIDGGGVYNTANPVMRNVTIRNNHSNRHGGGFYHLSGFPVLTNILMYGNNANTRGDAFYLSQNVLSCVNCTVAHNAGGGSEAVYITNGFHVFRNSIFWANTIDFNIVSPPGSVEMSHTMIDDAALPPGGFGGNVLLNTDPLLVNGGGGNFNLQPCSPGKDSGENSYNSSSIDLFGNNRFFSTIDRGAIELQSGFPPTVVTNTNDAGAGSLRDIISNACTSNTITFNSGLQGSTIVLTGPQIQITKNLNINGLGLDQLTISGNANSRIFQINPGITATIRDLNLVNGNAFPNVGNCILNQGLLTLRNMRLESTNGAQNPNTISNATGAQLTVQQQVILED